MGDTEREDAIAMAAPEPVKQCQQKILLRRRTKAMQQARNYIRSDVLPQCDLGDSISHGDRTQRKYGSSRKDFRIHVWDRVGGDTNQHALRRT